MKAVVYQKFGPPHVLQLVEHPLPMRSVGQVLVKIKSTSVNPVDYKIRNGNFLFLAKKEKVPNRYGSQVGPAGGCGVYRVAQSFFAHSDVGDLAGVIESADAGSKVTGRGTQHANLLPAFAQHLPYAAVHHQGQGVCSFPRLELHIKMGYEQTKDLRSHHEVL